MFANANHFRYLLLTKFIIFKRSLAKSQQIEPITAANDQRYL